MGKIAQMFVLSEKSLIFPFFISKTATYCTARLTARKGCFERSPVKDRLARNIRKSANRAITENGFKRAQQRKMQGLLKRRLPTSDSHEGKMTLKRVIYVQLTLTHAALFGVLLHAAS